MSFMKPKSLLSSCKHLQQEGDDDKQANTKNSKAKLMVYKPLHKRYNGRWAVGNQPTQPKRHSTEAT